LQPRTQARTAARAEAAERENELSLTVRKMMKQYFKDLDGETPSGIYNMVVNCVEKPLLEVACSMPRATRRGPPSPRHQLQHPAQEAAEWHRIARPPRHYARESAPRP
jgi:hypothetical protein